MRCTGGCKATYNGDRLAQARRMEARRRTRATLPSADSAASPTRSQTSQNTNSNGDNDMIDLYVTKSSDVHSGASHRTYRKRRKRRRWRVAFFRVCNRRSGNGLGGIFVAVLVLYALWSICAKIVFGAQKRRRSSNYLMGRMGHGYKAKPRVFAHYFADPTTSQLSSKHIPEALPLDSKVYQTIRHVEWTERDEKGQRGLLNSKRYEDLEHRALRPYQDAPECVPMHEWQTRTYPTCNDVHQIDLTDLVQERYRRHRLLRVLAHGYFRDVWAVREYDGVTLQAFKTLRYQHEFDEWNYERHRMDAVVFEVMTSSPRLLDIYNFCGNSGTFQFAPGGTVNDILYGDDLLPLEQRFDIAVQVSRAITDLHNFNHKAPAIAHADIYTNQFVDVNGRWKLNDFNRCTFLYWNSTSNEGNCPYKYGDYNAWLFRSPEEYEYSYQTEEIDIYSMGNIFYVLLMNIDTFEKEYDDGGSSRVHKMVKGGKRPELSEKVLASRDPIERVLIKAMKMCHVQDWRERATAKEVSDYLSKEWGKCVSDGRCKPGPDDPGFEVPV